MMTFFLDIYKILYRYYGPQHWWPAESPFEVMISAMLVQNTNWNNVELALQQLSPYLEPKRLESLSVEQLATLIRSSGYYNVKAKRIRAFLTWLKTYDYDLEKIMQRDGVTLRNELLQINGIGAETADCILVYALEKPYFIVDNYTRRIFYRVGLDMPKHYDDFQQMVEAYLPKDVALYNEYHALLVEHGKRHCRKKPLCFSCPLAELCQKRLDD